MNDVVDLSDFETEDDLAGYEYPADGQYHLVVSAVDDTRDKVDAVKVTFYVLAGTTAGQAGKDFEEAFWDPSPDNKDGGKFARKRRAKVLLASGVITPQNLGQALEVDWKALLNKQIKAAVATYERKGKDGKTYRGAQLEALDMWGPLDPAAQHIPQDEEALIMAQQAGQANVISVRGPAGQPQAVQSAVPQTATPAHAVHQAGASAATQAVQPVPVQQPATQQPATQQSLPGQQPVNDPYAGL